MQKAVIQLETLSCPSCMQKIENAVKGLNGVNQDSLKVLFNASKVKVDFDSEFSYKFKLYPWKSIVP